MGSPYRELPRYLLCPRCGETLSQVLEGVSSCLRCEGLWIAQGTLDVAFGDPQWPGGQVQWWRSSLDCPECTSDGHQTLMTARMSRDVLVDHCSEHGVWLDRGELGRLMGTTSNELAVLRERLALASPDLKQLTVRRDRWRADLETRRRADRDDRQAREADRRYRAKLAAQAAAAAPAPAAPSSLDRRQALGTERAQTSAAAVRLQDQLRALRDHIHRLDAELAGARDRAASLEDELDATRARLAALDAALDAPG
jgi:Zn-finger nucleic acid-binding protein